MPEELPDPVLCAAHLDALAWQTTDPEQRRLLRYSARYILAGIEVAAEIQARRLEDR